MAINRNLAKSLSEIPMLESQTKISGLMAGNCGNFGKVVD